MEKKVLGGPGEIRTLVSGSRAFGVRDLDQIIHDFWQYCSIEERLGQRQSRDYRNIARRFLQSSKGVVSRQAIREYLKGYL
ncbi:MAG: hypothetical protein JSV85_04810 [Candidatus Bathyarchaeota archaeon]|nr:MAG: hypothetical protein JSV85_04810 [Candidatus Bathyarchaeota archaeon]